jgi:hypothetical protein
VRPNPVSIVRLWKFEVFDELLGHAVVVVLATMNKHSRYSFSLRGPDQWRHLYDLGTRAYYEHHLLHVVFTVQNVSISGDVFNTYPRLEIVPPKQNSE